MAILKVVRPELDLLDSTQLFDTSMAEWAKCPGYDCAAHSDGLSLRVLRCANRKPIW